MERKKGDTKKLKNDYEKPAIKSQKVDVSAYAGNSNKDKSNNGNHGGSGQISILGPWA